MNLQCGCKVGVYCQEAQRLWRHVQQAYYSGHSVYSKAYNDRLKEYENHFKHAQGRIPVSNTIVTKGPQTPYFKGSAR